MRRSRLSAAIVATAAILIFGCAGEPTATNSTPEAEPDLWQTEWPSLQERGSETWFLGLGVGDTREEAEQKARQGALANAAATSEVQLRSELEILTSQRIRSSGAGSTVTEAQDVVGSMRAVSDRVFREASVAQSQTRKAAGGVECRVYVKVATDDAFPHRRLTACLHQAEALTPDAAAQALLGLAHDYRHDGLLQLTVLAGEFALQRTPAKTATALEVARYREDVNDLWGAISVLERTRVVVADAESKALLDAERARLIERLGDYKTCIDRLLSLIRANEHRAKLRVDRRFDADVSSKIADLPAAVSTDSARWLCMVWLDADGVYAYGKPTRITGDTVIHLFPGTAAGPIHVLFIAANLPLVPENLKILAADKDIVALSRFHGFLKRLQDSMSADQLVTADVSFVQHSE